MRQNTGRTIITARRALAAGYYVIVPVETRYIREYDFDSVHDMMIYGFGEDGCFYIADHFSGGKYRKAVCSAEELKAAISGIRNPETWTRGFEGTIDLLSCREKERAKFELYRVIESLQDYLESRATSRWDVNRDVIWDSDEVKNRCFGMECYEGVFQNIRIAKEQGRFPESGHRALFLEQEHKKIMEMRLLWMKEKYPISDEFIEKYRMMAKWGGIAMTLKLKYDRTGDGKLPDRIEEYYKLIQEEEIGLLPRLIGELGCY